MFYIYIVILDSIVILIWKKCFDKFNISILKYIITCAVQYLANLSLVRYLKHIKSTSCMLLVLLHIPFMIYVILCLKTWLKQFKKKAILRLDQCYGFKRNVCIISIARNCFIRSINNRTIILKCEHITYMHAYNIILCFII